MSAIARKVLALVGLIVVIFSGGYLSGLYLAPLLTANTATEEERVHGNHTSTDAHEIEDHSNHEHGADDHAGHDHAEHTHGDPAVMTAAKPADEHDEELLVLTKQAFDNLELKLGMVLPQDYWKSQAVPGEIVEIPGRSRLAISAPVTGVVESILASNGQNVSPSNKLFNLRITDEYLANSQSEMLANLAKSRIVQQEIIRLAPLTASGAIAGRKSRDLQYELTQLESKQAVLRQQMLSRGLPQSMITDVASGRMLANQLAVTAPNFSSSEVIANTPGVRPVALTSPSRADYAVEAIHVQPGQTVERGDPLCTLSNHAELYIRGEAFENDLPLLNQLVRKDWEITAEFGHAHNQSDESVIRRQLKLLRIDNEISSETQTVTFYLPLTNEIEQTVGDDRGNAFTHWRFKPGQRIHLKLPVEKWERQLVLPLDAVMIDGPNAIVFVEHQHKTNDAHAGHSHSGNDHSGHDEEDHEGHDHEDHAGQDHSGHDHAEHDHAEHNHAEHNHGDHDHSGHDHSGHDHGQNEHGTDTPHNNDDGHQHDHGTAHESETSDDDLATGELIELEPIAVRLLHRDDQFAVIANDGRITRQHRVALNAAYQLHKAMKMQVGEGGGGDHHGHEH